MVADRLEHAQLFGTEVLAAEQVLPRAHPVDIALDGVDLAVVRQVTERLRPTPGREGIGRKARVVHGQRRHGLLVLQIQIVLTHLGSGELPLVDNGAGRQGCYIEVFFSALQGFPDPVGSVVTQHIEFALEGLLIQLRRAGKKYLLDLRLFFQRSLPQGAVVLGHQAPAEQGDTQTLGVVHQHATASFAQIGIPREEHHANGVVTRLRQMDPLFRHAVTQHGVGNLDQDTGTITTAHIKTGAATVLHTGQHGQRVLDDCVALFTLQAGDKANATTIMLQIRAIQTPGLLVKVSHH